jgi:cell wall-associated NlpC family hydrolase
MSALDEITVQKRRVGEGLARLDEQREKLAGQLSELEAAERVLTRYSKGRPAKNTSPMTPTTATDSATPARSRGRPRSTTAETAVGKRSSPSLADQVLALATGKTQQEIAAACKRARPNHVGAALARHKRAGRIEERDGRLYGRQATQTEQRAAL